MSTARPFDRDFIPYTTLAGSHATHTVAIVGGGFSGTVLAANLLRRAKTSTRIVLIERNARIGRGLAYANSDYPYLLNVPAARMSVNPQDPMEFLHFARRVFPHVTGNDYLPRSLYGDYLEHILFEAESAAPLHVSLTRVHAQAHRLSQFGRRLHVQLDNGAHIFADDVVLASGNPSPAELPGWQNLQGHPAYFENPWKRQGSFDSRHSVVIIGTGLSMADVVLKLTDNEHSMPQIHAISRHGLLPAAQSSTHGAIEPQLLNDVASATTARQLLTNARELSARLQAQGRDWRDLVNGIRGIAPRLWQRLSAQERRRFLRHVQSYWDVCRHRLPGDVLEHIHSVRDAGKLNIVAGRIRSLHAVGRRIAVEWRARGQNHTQILLADAVVNACGPDYRLEHSRDPLTRQLHADGWITADKSGVGLHTATHGALVGRDASIHRHLYYLGPLLRGAHWETTAAAELRAHAIQLAAILATDSVRKGVALA